MRSEAENMANHLIYNVVQPYLEFFYERVT